MVYCGAPSHGCYDCRQRKTRCDKFPLPGGCTQCARAKRRCRGYREAGEVRFRDESNNVVRKFKAKEARLRQAASSTSASISGGENVTGSEKSLEIMTKQIQRNLSLWHTLTPTVEERATGFFVSNYVLPLRGPSLGHFDYIPELYKTQRVGKCLDASIAAVGLASYSYSTRTPSLMNNARYQYVNAIRLTNEALKSSEDVKKDSTLLAIMILGLFEAFTGSKRASLQDWADHIDGAALVIKSRGRDQLDSPAGRRMVIHVASSLLISCIQRAVRMPDFMRELIAETRMMISNPDPSFVIQETTMEYASLHASVADGSCSDLEAIIARALELDSILLEFFVNVPRGWDHETVFTDIGSENIYNRRYHIYFDYWIAQMWNSMRVLRILLNQKIRDALLKGFSSKPPLFTQAEYTVQFQISTDLLYEMQADILATIPQHIGLVSRSTSLYQSAAASEANTLLPKAVWNKFRDSSSDFQPTNLSGGYFLIWPLWFAGTIDIATKPMRQFVVKNLRSIGHDMGIQQALILATTIESRIENQPRGSELGDG